MMQKSCFYCGKTRLRSTAAAKIFGLHDHNYKSKDFRSISDEVTIV
jgi:predicted protein tyrosine phosphatase